MTNSFACKLESAINSLNDFGDKLYSIYTAKIGEETFYDSNLNQLDFFQLSTEAFNIQQLINHGEYKKAIPNIRALYIYFEDRYFTDSLMDFDFDYDEELKKLYTIVDILNKGIEFTHWVEKDLTLLTDVKDDMLSFISENPEYMHNLSPRLFEKLVAKVFSKYGMQVELTKQTRDGGYDIFGIHDLKYTQIRYLIECKKYAPNRKVDINIVRSLLGVNSYSQANKVMIVTSSSFTKDVLDFVKQHSYLLDIVDYNKLCQWLKTYWGNNAAQHFV